MAATAGPPPSTGQPQEGDVELTNGDEVKEYNCHEGDGENEYLNPMDLHDIKSELEKDAEKAETPQANTTVSSSEQAISTSSAVGNNQTIQLRPTFVLQGLQYGGISYGYPPAGLVSGLPIDQTFQSPYTLRMPGQYITQMPYTPQQLSLPFGTTPIAPNASVHPNSGMIVPQQKEKKPHIKKPLNAFMLFMKEKRAEVMKECTLKESAAINQILGKMWHKLDKAQQAKYYEMAREERSRHMKMYPNWSARDNYAIHKKRKKKKPKSGDSGKNDEDSDDHCVSGNVLKCRARLGLDKQEMWCEGCRKKKKCIRSNGDDQPSTMTFSNPVKLENQT